MRLENLPHNCASYSSKIVERVLGRQQRKAKRTSGGKENDLNFEHQQTIAIVSIEREHDDFFPFKLLLRRNGRRTSACSRQIRVFVSRDKWSISNELIIVSDTHHCTRKWEHSQKEKEKNHKIKAISNTVIFFQ